jgi:hypothetical protein
MMPAATDSANRTPEEIQEQIAARRRALDHKLERLGDRLDPRVRLEEVKDRIAARSPQYLAWGAVAAVLAGVGMAMRGWRGRRVTDQYLSPDHPAIDPTHGRVSDTSF